MILEEKETVENMKVLSTEGTTSITFTAKDK